MRMKKVSICIALIGCALLIGCKQTKTEEKNNIRIGVTLYDQYDAFISEMINAFKEEATGKSEETGVAINVEIMNASGSQTTQNKQVRSMINAGYDVICVNLVDRTDTTSIIDIAKEEDVPIIFFNRELVAQDLERWDRLYYVGARAFESGILEGEQVVDYYKSHPEMDKNGDGVLQYIVLEGETGHQDAIVRTEYSTNTIEEAGITLEKVGYCLANWNRDQANAKVQQLITQDIYPELIISNNDYMAIGAIDAYDNNNVPESKRAVIFGIDGIKEGLEAVAEGRLAATVYNDKEGQAAAMLELASRIALGQDISDLELIDGKYIRLPYTKVNRGNLSDYNY